MFSFRESPKKERLDSSSPKMKSQLTDTFISRISAVKVRKVSILKEHLRERTKNIALTPHSLQLPRYLPGRERLTVDPKITSSSFFVQIHTPKTQRPTIELPTRKRQLTVSSECSNSSNRVKSRSERDHSEESIAFNKNMKKLIENLDEDGLEKRLGMLSKEKGKNFIRVYREVLSKIICQRYGKDRVTGFLELEYIEDYPSILKKVKEMVTWKKEEVLVFVFLILDYNKDGFITAEDLTNLIGTKKDSSETFNDLVMHDISKIINSVEKRKKEGDSVFDCETNPIFKDEYLTYVKFRIHNYRQRKTPSETKRCHFFNRIHDHLYSLREEKEKNEANVIEQQKLLMELIPDHSKKEMIFGQNMKFSIGFSSFSQIFQNEVPNIFIDFLYTLGGIEVEGFNYLKLNSIPPLNMSQSHAKNTLVEDNKIEKMMLRLQQMNNFKRDLKTFRICTRY